MSKVTKIIATVLTASLVVVFLYSQGFKSPSDVVASVARGGEYQATSTYPTVLTARHTLIDNTYGTLGSVIISSTTAGTMKIWNATSTTDSASTTIATFAASAANGTYTFDAIITRGLIIETSIGFAGGYTITHR